MSSNTIPNLIARRLSPVTVFQDVRYGLRQLIENPGFTIVAVLSLALGMGANTTVFSVINSVLFEPLPYPHPERLVEIFETTGEGNYNTVAGGAYKDWRDNNSVFDRIAVFEQTQKNWTGEGMPERVSGLRVSSEYLSVLGVKPTLGRDFTEGEDAVGEDSRIAILSHQLWRSRFDGDESVVGKVVSLDRIPHTVIGVLPPYALLDSDALFLIPDVVDEPGANWSRAGHWRRVIGRLKPEIAALEAQAQLKGIKQQLNAEYPPYKKDWSVAVVSIKEIYLFLGNVRPAFAILLGTALMVLLIACANVSNLMLARGAARSREMAIRSALGARSWQLVRQILIECLLLAFAGCAMGFLIAMYGVDLLAGAIVNEMPQIMKPRLNVDLLVFSAIVACGCGILFGVLPAWNASRLNLNRDLKEAERGSTSASKRRTQSFLVATQYALTLLLLIGMGLFLRSFVRLMDVDPGFNPKQTVAFDLSYPETKYPNPEDRLRFIQDLNRRIEALPGVECAGAAFAVPLSGAGRTEQVCRADLPPRQDYVVGCNFVSGDFFSAMGMRLLRGRLLTEADDSPTAPRVFVIDSGIARDLYPGENPIGRSLRFFGEKWKIVGVVETVRHFRLDGEPRPTVYMSQARALIPTGAESVVVRTALSSDSIAKSIRQTVFDADPYLPIANLRTLEQSVDRALAHRKAVLILLGLFAAIAVVLACVGVYGLTAYAVSQRINEIGVRIALGAQAQNIVAMILASSMKLTVVGILCGLMGAFALSRFIQSMLFQVAATDWLTYAAAPLGLTIVALLACYLPARRAARTDPMITLRCE